MRNTSLQNQSVFGVFWSLFPRILTEYGDLQSKSPYSVRMREDTDQKNSKYRHFSRRGIVSILTKKSAFIAIYLQNISCSFKKILHNAQENACHGITFQQSCRFKPAISLKRSSSLVFFCKRCGTFESIISYSL